MENTLNMQPPFDKHLLTLLFMIVMNLVARVAENCPLLLNLVIPAIFIQILQTLSYAVTITIGIMAIIKKINIINNTYATETDS